jgi:hypothetical protein
MDEEKKKKRKGEKGREKWMCVGMIHGDHLATFWPILFIKHVMWMRFRILGLHSTFRQRVSWGK